MYLYLPGWLQVGAKDKKNLAIKKKQTVSCIVFEKFWPEKLNTNVFFWPKQSNQLKAEVPVSDWSRIADRNAHINKASQASVAIAAINKYNFNDKLLITQYMRILSSFFN